MAPILTRWSSQRCVMDELERIRLSTRAVVDKAAREIAVGKLIPATVVTYEVANGFTGAVAMVHIDGDPPGAFRPVSVLIPYPLTRNDRVMVLYDPPEGAYVWGLISPTAIHSSRSTMACGTWSITLGDNDSTWTMSNSYVFDSPAESTEVRMVGSLDGYDSATLRVFKNGIQVASTVVSGSFDAVVGVASSWAAADELSYTLDPVVDYTGDYLEIDSFDITGGYPDSSPGGGAGYTLRASFQENGLEFDSDTSSGGDPGPNTFTFTTTGAAPIRIGDPAPDLGVSLTFTVWGAGDNFNVTGISISGTRVGSEGVSVQFGTGDDVQTIDVPAGGFSYTSAPSTPTVVDPGSLGALFQVHLFPTTPPTIHIESIVMSLTGTHAAGSLVWNTGG